MAEEITTLADILEVFTDSIYSEIDSVGLGKWSIEVSGVNFLDSFDDFYLEDLKDLCTELKEGGEMIITIDLAPRLLIQLEQMIKQKELLEDEDNLSE